MTNPQFKFRIKQKVIDKLQALLGDEAWQSWVREQIFAKIRRGK